MEHEERAFQDANVPLRRRAPVFEIGRRSFARHLKEYFAESGDELPSIFNFGVGLGSLAPGLMAGAVKKNVTQMAKMFITGETPDEALSVLKKARKNKIGFTVDLLGEACLSETEAVGYQKEIFGAHHLARERCGELGAGAADR